MKIAIIGGGFAGLGAAWHLLQNPEFQVALFEKKGIGSGASGLTTALLHPYPGKHARRTLNAEDAMDETLALLDIAEEALGSKVADRSGILRPAITDQQKEDFYRVAVDDPNTEWWNEDQCQQRVPHITRAPGVFIKQGVSVFSSLYLEGLLKACLSKGLMLISEEIAGLYELEDYNHTVIAAGAGILKFPECAHLPFRITKGQILVCEGVDLPFAICSQGHISSSIDKQAVFLGSTFEHDFKSIAPDDRALTLQAKISLFYPPAADLKIIDRLSGIRISRQGAYYPLIEKVTEKAWAITCLGSRGLLYHALLGKELCKKLNECCSLS